MGLIEKNKDCDPLVSVVITTKNEEKNIRNCLESLRHQTWHCLEVIVVDNHSTDQTVGIAREYTDKVFTKGPERSTQRNFGMIDKSTGEYVMYIDADMVLSPTLIEACVNHIFSSGAVALHVPEIVLGRNYFSCVRRFERSFYSGTPIDGARFFHRSGFVQVGGFDDLLFLKGSGEDWDIDKRIKKLGRIELLPQFSDMLPNQSWTMKDFVEKRGVIHDNRYAGVYHNESEFRIFPYLQKKAYYSLGFDGYINKWGAKDPDIRAQFGLFYRFWTLFTENGKWKNLCARPHLAFGMYFLRFCVGSVYLLNKIRPLEKKKFE